MTIELHRAVGGGFQAHQDLGEGRFSATGLPDDSHSLRGPGVQTDMFVRFHVTDPLARDHGRDRVVPDLVILLHRLDGEDFLAGFQFGPVQALGLIVRPVDLLPLGAAHDVAVLPLDLGHGDRRAFRDDVATAALEEVAARTEVTARRAIMRQRELTADRHQGGSFLSVPGRGIALKSPLV